MLSKKAIANSAPVKDRALKAGKKLKAQATVDVSRFQEEVQVQAYYNFLKRMKNNISGNEERDWFEAEKSVRLNQKNSFGES